MRTSCVAAAVWQVGLPGAFGCAADAIGGGWSLLALQNIHSEGELTNISNICAAGARALLVQAFRESPLQGIYYCSSTRSSCQKEARCVCRQAGDVAGLCMGQTKHWVQTGVRLNKSHNKGVKLFRVFLAVVISSQSP